MMPNALQEIELLIAKTNENPLEPYDIVSDRRSVTALCLLCSSMVSGEVGLFGLQVVWSSFGILQVTTLYLRKAHKTVNSITDGHSSILQACRTVINLLI